MRIAKHKKRSHAELKRLPFYKKVEMIFARQRAMYALKKNRGKSS